jgi:hypothetical protein
VSNPPHDEPAGGDAAGATVATRWPELLLALFLAALALLVIKDSLRVGIGWADDGPRSGYFPFYIGLLLVCSSGWVLVSQLLRWRADSEEFATRRQIGLVVSVLVPMVVYVGLILALGIYAASALLIGYFMARHGRYPARLTLPVALGVPLIFFAVFEKWFLVPLPKGPIEGLLGL